MVIHLAMPLAFVLIAFSGASVAAGKCDEVAQGSSSYIRATSLVSAFPEFRKWSKTHSFPVAFGPKDRQVSLRGKCYWAVSVYADRADRFESWHLFYVHLPTKAILIQEPSTGEEISLESWRTKNKRAANQSMIPNPSFHPTANGDAVVVG
jgi:hypothetical protein